MDEVQTEGTTALSSIVNRLAAKGTLSSKIIQDAAEIVLKVEMEPLPHRQDEDPAYKVHDYRTTVNRCTCAAGKYNHACKHRVAVYIWQQLHKESSQGKTHTMETQHTDTQSPNGNAGNAIGNLPAPQRLQALEEQAVERAYQETEERYLPYLMTYTRFNTQEKRQGRSAYMQVDGRVKMVHDQFQGVDIETEFLQVGEKWLAKAIVKVTTESAISKSATAHAEVNLGARAGADSTNPFSVGETSAIGRALGFLGLGLYGGGIASAEDIEAYLEAEKTQTATRSQGRSQQYTQQQTRSTSQAPIPQGWSGNAPANDQQANVPNMTGSTPDAPPTERQIHFLRELYEKVHNVTGERFDAALAQIPTRQRASEVIDRLRQSVGQHR